MFVTEAIAVVGFVSSVAGLHSWYTGLKAGDQLDQAIAQLHHSRKRVEHLSDEILLAPWLHQVYPLKGDPQILVNRKEIRKVAEPLPEPLHSRILLGSLVSTPTKLRKVLQNNPQDVLLDVSPVAQAKPAWSPNLVPVLFFQDGTLWVGWQARGALPLMLGCEFERFDAVVPGRVQGSQEGRDSVILDLPAHRTHLLSVHRHCRVSLTQDRLIFTDRDNERLSFAIDRSVILRILPRDGALQIDTVGGRRRRIEGSSIVLERVLEELRGF
jgi:hypothetical protein